MKFKRSPAILNLLIAIAVVSIITLYFYFSKFQGNITGFFRIGSFLPLSPYLNPEHILIYQGEIGYDGQQFLSIALDPFLQNPQTINALDHPVYRYRRILYPLLSYLLSFGNRVLIPYVMVFLNYLSIILMVGVSNLYFKSEPRFKWQPLLILCIPGVWIVLALATADLLSSLLLLVAIYGYQSDKPRLTGIAIALACLTRETLLLMWLAIFLTSIWQKKRRQIKYLLWVPLPALGWLFYIQSLHLSGGNGVKANFGYPLFGIEQKLITLVTGGLNGRTLFEAYLFGLLLLIFGASFIICQYHYLHNRLIQVCTLLLSVMFIFSSITILGYYLDYSRVFMDAYFLLLLSFNFSSIPGKTALLLASGIGSLAFLALHS